MEWKERGEEGRKTEGVEEREGKDDSWSLGDRRPYIHAFAAATFVLAFVAITF